MLTTDLYKIQQARSEVKELVKKYGLIAVLHGLNDVVFSHVECHEVPDPVYIKANKALFAVILEKPFVSLEETNNV